MLPNRFQLEEQMLGCWSLVDDLYALHSGWDSLTNESRRNIVLGLADLYGLKFQQQQDTFETLVANKQII